MKYTIEYYVIVKQKLRLKMVSSDSKRWQQENRIHPTVISTPKPWADGEGSKPAWNEKEKELEHHE